MMLSGARHGLELSLRDADRHHGRNCHRATEPHRVALSTTDKVFVRVAVAKSPREIEAAHRLVRRRYAWRGYEIDWGGDPDVPSTHSRSDQEITFIAANNEVIGTVTLGLDGPLGLRAEETHGDVIHLARAAGRRVCELTRLAVEEQVDSKPVLASLFRLVYAAGRAIHDITDVFIEVNPRHVLYYARVLGFVVAGGEKLCERVRAPSVLLHVEIETLSRHLEALIERLAPQRVVAEAA
jgi:hypothetical protein